MDQLSTAAIGGRLAMYRKNAGLTAEDLAESTNGAISANAIAKLENGHRAQISSELVAALARALHISPLALLFPLHNPDAAVTVSGVTYNMRQLGGWVFGLSPHDQVTETFRQLVASDRAMSLSKERLAGSTSDEAADRIRRDIEDERDRQSYLMGLLDSVQRTMEARRRKADGER